MATILARAYQHRSSNQPTASVSFDNEGGTTHTPEPRRPPETTVSARAFWKESESPCLSDGTSIGSCPVAREGTRVGAAGVACDTEGRGLTARPPEPNLEALRRSQTGTRALHRLHSPASELERDPLGPGASSRGRDPLPESAVQQPSAGPLDLAVAGHGHVHDAPPPDGTTTAHPPVLGAPCDRRRRAIPNRRVIERQGPVLSAPHRQ